MNWFERILPQNCVKADESSLHIIGGTVTDPSVLPSVIAMAYKLHLFISNSKPHIPAIVRVAPHMERDVLVTYLPSTMHETLSAEFAPSRWTIYIEPDETSLYDLT